MSSLGVAAILLVAIVYLRRAFLVIHQLTFPLVAAAVAAALKVFTVLQAGQFPLLDVSASWVLLFVPVAFALRLVGLYWFEVHLKSHRGVQLPSLLQPFSMGLAYLAAGFVTLKAVNPSLDVSPLLTTSAISSLVLGLALQPILGNLFAGVVISLQRPFRINDCIKIGDTFGRVIQVTWYSTHLRTREDDVLIVPNSRVSGETVLNYYYPYPMHLERIRVGAHYSAPPYRVQRALLDCVAGVESALEKPSPDVYVLSFDDSAITYELRVWVDDVMSAPRVASQIRAKIWAEFKRRGIAIPYPIRTIELAPRVRSRAAGDRPAARVFVADGSDAGQSFDLGAGPVVVGRTKTCAVALTDTQVSKEHCRIEWGPTGYVLTDLGSSFGTRLNDRAVTQETLTNLDHVTVGATTLVVEIDES
jgi:small-conductance mechanosensitive channel